jgi:plasmid stability protein
MSNYILRNADPELWQAFRARALAEGHSLRWLILELVRRYVAAGLDRPAP